jgi:hypothetical protein
VLTLIFTLYLFNTSTQTETLHKINYEKYVWKNVNLGLQKYNRKWSWTEKKSLVDALIIGEYIYDIDFKIVLAIIGIESNFKIYAKNQNKNNTWDYGLTQQNSKYCKERFSVARKIIQVKKFSYYNIKLNILSAFIYLKNLGLQDRNLIMAYNVGKQGIRTKRYIGEKYYKKFQKEIKIYKDIKLF